MLLAATMSVAATAQEWAPGEWPVMKCYDNDHLYQIALPIGGIGTGVVSLGGRGELRDWEIMNIPAKHFSTGAPKRLAPFFAVFTKSPDGEKTTTMLAGKLLPWEIYSSGGTPADNYGLPRFDEASFDAAYPFGQVHLKDSALPVEVTIKGFNPFVPTDAEKSGLPVAVLSYKVRNLSDKPLEVSVCGSMCNFIGRDGAEDIADGNKNVFRTAEGISGIHFLPGENEDSSHQAWGTMALTTMAKEGTTYRTNTAKGGWNIDLLSFWDDFSDDGRLNEITEYKGPTPMASLAVKKTIGAGESKDFTFYLTWSFPNRKAWAKEIVGNYYCLEYDDAWKAAEKILPRIPELEKETLRFVECFNSSTLPDCVKEAALFNLATLRSQTVFRIPSGHLMAWEGTGDNFGWCKGTCNHVWNYEVATAFLFGNLAMTMRDVEFNYASKDNGFMSIRAELPLSIAYTGTVNPAADGQMGCVMKAYREWQLSGDGEYLKAFYPKVKKCLEYAWIPKGWDGNQDGVMEGCQHNTMDVEYYGPNPQMQFWYLGALVAASKMADAVKDKGFASKCRDLYARGSKWTDDNLFNGEYYEHKITDPETFEFLDMDDPNTVIPDYQLGRGCLVDQLVGQYMAHICGLGYLGDKDHIQTTLKNIMRYNYVEDVSHIFNNMRSYVSGHESALLMAAWPKGRLKIPFPYFGEAMTGFEYCAAVGMIYEGQVDSLKCIKAIRDRFDGLKRSPFNEPECGYHYGRSMTSWSSVLALSDFHYSAVEKTMNFTSKPGRYFWSNGYSYGSCEVAEDHLRLEVVKGSVDLKALTLSGKKKAVAKNISLSEGESEIIPILR